ncbi:MAG: hypothetical protein K2X32_01525 [Phycisphaerales bacterium]|nr:hypothetical protein [Phycisphaerales bacterium]
MSTSPLNTQDSPKRAYRSAEALGPPPADAAVVDRLQAAALMGVSLTAFGVWERDGRVTIPRYRVALGAARPIFYLRADVERLCEEFRKLQEPYPDPERPGVYRVPIRSHKERREALIDAQDLPKVQGKHWNVSRRSGSGEIEVILSSMRERATPLKRIILGLDGADCKERLVCFVNGDPLDCRRENLVIQSRSEVNRGISKMTVRAGRVTSSKYKGVLWDAKRRLWKAQIGPRGAYRQLGRFRDEAQAAAAYDAAAGELFGGSAALNFPDGHIPAPTFLGPDGQPVREKNRYRVPRGLPSPPPGVAMLSREEAAAVLEVSGHTFGIWELAGHVSIPRYRQKATTGTPILYAASDIARLRDELDKVGQPYPDPHPARAGVWRVPLRTLAGYVEALIDEADLGLVQGKKWNFVTHSGLGLNRGAVIEAGRRDAPAPRLKRLILGVQDQGPMTRIIYANGNPLDCRRINLVLRGPDKSTRRGYKILRRAGRPTTSRFKGVCWNEREGAWQSQIRVDDKPKKLGTFDDERDAALAYDEAARELWGAEARVNFPEPGELPSAAAPVAPADLSQGAKGPAARMPGKPTDFSAVLNQDGSVTISWRSTSSAASAGVTFAVSRKLPGQRQFVRIGTADGSTSASRRPSFTDATVPAEHLAARGKGAEYVVRAARGTTVCEASDVLVVKFDADGNFVMSAALARAA